MRTDKVYEESDYERSQLKKKAEENLRKVKENEKGKRFKLVPIPKGYKMVEIKKEKQ